MEELIIKFPQQLRIAIQKGSALSAEPVEGIQNIVVAGMGGSAIAANVAAGWLRNELKVPYEVVRDYRLPAYVNENTFFVSSSCSGNTEETLSALDDAIRDGAQVHCITSGGKMAEIAEEHNYLRASMPSGKPPRSCLGANLVGLLSILKARNVIDGRLLEELEAAADFLETEQENIRKKSKELANQLLGKNVLIYPPVLWDAIGLRWKQQLNENSKMQSWHHSLPEMNHNEVVGWRGNQSNFAAVVFDSPFVNERTRFRAKVVEELVERSEAPFIRINCPGKSLVLDTMYLIHLGDFLSLELCLLQGFDPIEIENLDFVKARLAEF